MYKGAYMFKNLLAGIMAGSLVLSAQAQSTWETDPAHSSINFTIAHMVIADITGKFNEFKCTIKTPGDDFSNARVQVQIQAASVFTNNEKRDNHLRSADFFDVEKYPEITFESTSFEKTGEDTYKITGNLSMHGVTRLVVLEAAFRGQIKDPRGHIKAGFKATTSLDRYDYNLTWNTTLETGGLLVGKVVSIEIDLELFKK
jgi:polyisoprenoid-binding protein YceI